MKTDPNEEKGLMPHIGEIWAFLSVDADGDEGVCAFQAGRNWMPMVCADHARLESLLPVAKMIAKQTGKAIRLVKFTGREEVQLIEPPP